MQRLSPIDAAFLRMESTRTPMHVGCLLTFHLPRDAPAGFLRELVAHLQAGPFMPAPFDCRLARSPLARILPAWEEAEVDMEYHVRHSALPRPGGERDLGALVTRLHSHPMDLDRPLWELHVIEGLARRRFAIYMKAHHCAIDGVGAMSMIKNWLSPDPEDRSPPPAMPSPHREGRPHGTLDLLRRSLAGTGRRALAAGELTARLAALSRGEDSMVHASLETPRTLFNVPVSQQRRLGTQLLPLARFKAVARALDATVNDVVLAVCGGAVRRYLRERDGLPARSLTASVPVGLEREGHGGNAVAGFVCPLATDEDDPVRRVRRIHAATQRAKSDLQRLSGPALENLALTGLAPLILGQMTGTLARLPPMFNFVVSNVVLTRHKLYLMGAELEAMYPMSFLFDGHALNVTAIGYADNIAIGFIGCRKAVPKLQNLAVYAGEALAELETATRVRRRAGKRASRKGAKTPSRKNE